MDFFARQESARRATRWLLVTFLFCVALVVLAVGLLVYGVASSKSAPGESAAAPAVLAAVITALVIFGASLFKSLSLRSGGAVVARSLGGTRVERGTRDLALRRLHNVVEEMAIASGVAMPEIYVLENEDGINAFAAGNTPADAAVAVTRGALTRLNREELQGVIAHEFSHVLNGDMRLNSKLLGWVFGLLVVAIAMRLVVEGMGRGRSRDKGGAIILVAIAIMAVGYIGVFVGRILQAAVSRHRERLADASAVQFTRNPQGLVGALLKIGGVASGSKIASPAKDEVAHMLFAPGMQRLFATHPPLSERVRELDPAVARENFDKLVAAAALQAENQRLAPQFADVAEAAAQFAAPSDGNTAPVRVAGLTGTFDEAQQRYAHEARQAIPQELHTFADSPEAARRLLFALLRSAEPAVSALQDQVIRKFYGEALLSGITEAQSAVRALPAALRLPAVQQLLPALRRMTPAEQRELQLVTEKFALADERIDVFECSLALLLDDALRAQLELHDEHGSRSLLNSVDSVGTLFAVLASHGAEDDTAARRAFDAGMKTTLPHHSREYGPVARWPEALRKALDELRQLRPFAKKVLIEGLVRTVAHDRRLSVAEGELLRTVCAVLHCPLPPLLASRPGS